MHYSRIRTAHFGGFHCMSVLGGVSVQGVSIQVVSVYGVFVQDGLYPEDRPPPPVDRMTHASVTITFTQLCWRMVAMQD